MGRRKTKVFFSGPLFTGFSELGGSLCVLCGGRSYRFTAWMAWRTFSGVKGNSLRRAPVAL